MFLGCLATIAERGPKNLCVIIFDNGTYQITGGQKALTSSVADIVEIAKGCGLKQARWAADESHYDYLVGRALNEPGPWLIAVRIDGAKPASVSDRDPPRIRRAFQMAMQQPV
jgi:thiamine pyrophosphate-dependent acetolactate synthase large subunit-like protein